jgi:chromosome segregation ATPase
MAPTIDDIVEILGNIQTQDAQNNDNLKSYFEEFKKVLEEKQNITSEKFDALQNNFNEILSRPSEASNTQELHDLFDNFQKHAGEIFDGINSQKALVDHFNQVIEQLSTNITDKEEIVSHIVELKNKINESSEAFATTNQYALNCIQDLNTNLNSIMLQDNNHEIRVQLENLANITNNTLATLKEFNQKTDTLADAIKNLINSDEYVKAWQKIYAISDTTSEIAARLSYLPLKSDTDEINQKIDTVKEDINNVVIQNSTEKFEKINNILSEMAQNLIEQQRNLYFENQNSENPDSYQAISEDIKKLEDTFNTNAQNYKVIIYETLTQIKSALDTQKDEVNGIISNSCGNNTVINDKLVNLESLSNGFKSSIEEILSGIQTVNQNLSAVDSSTVTNDDVKQEIETVKALSGNIVEMLNTFNTKNEEFEQTINSMVSSESYNTSVQKLDTLCAQGEELMVKISQLPAREEISDILNNISQDILKLSEDFTNQNNEYQTKIENIRSTIESYLNEIKDYADKQGYNVSQDFQDRLYSIENTLNTQASEQKEKIEKFNSEIENYMNLTNELANKSNEKFTTSSNEIAEIKNELQDISDIISSINANTEYKFSESVNYLDSNIQKVITNLEDMKATVEAGCNLTSLQGCLDSINYRFDEISNVLDTLKDSVTPDEEQPHDTITDLDDKLTTLKQEIDLVHTDIIDSVNNKYETIIKNIEVLKTDISEIIGYDFDKNFADLKAQIEMSFLSTGSDIKNASTEQQDAISSLEQVYKDIQNQITSVDESIKNNIPDRIELLRVTIENFTRNLEVNINKTSNFIDNWQNDLEEIKNFTTDVKTSLSKKLDAYTSEIKNQIINSDGTEKTLQVLDNLRASMESGIAEITNIQSDKVMELGSKIKDVVIEACENSLDRINSTIENVNALGTMTSDNDKIVSVIDNLKNILSNEISTKLQKYADEQNQQLEKIKADIDSYVYSEQIEDEKSKILDDINTIKETNQDNENILNIVSKLEKKE